MAPATTSESRQSRKGQQLAKQIHADLGLLPSLSYRKLSKKEEDKFIDTFLDSYQIFLKVQKALPMSGMFDDENGTLITLIEDSERLLRDFLKSKNTRVVRITPIWLDLLQQLRWSIMIHDGVAEMRKTDGKVYKSASDFMASLDHE